jgi:hypothetical protein
MDCCYNILATNAGGIPYIVSTSTNINTESVDIAFGFRKVQPVGYLTFVINDVIPSDTTTTLPVTLTMSSLAGNSTRNLVLPNGTPVTAAELLGVNTILVFNDRKRNLLVLMSRTID